MTYDQIKQNLIGMVSGATSPTPKAAFERIVELETALHRIAYWLERDQELLDAMPEAERADRIRMHKIALAALF